MAREPVGAQQQPITRHEVLDEDVGLYAAVVADEPRDAMRDVARVILRELPRAWAVAATAA